jgi:NADH-quinone oxidoreductase subunit K
MDYEIGLLHNYLVVGVLLFGIGMIGVLSRRNVLVVFLAAEIMLQGVSVSLVALSRFHNNFDGQMLVFVSIALAGCRAALVVALMIVLLRRSGALDVLAWGELRESSPPRIDPEFPPD